MVTFSAPKVPKKCRFHRAKHDLSRPILVEATRSQTRELNATASRRRGPHPPNRGEGAGNRSRGGNRRNRQPQFSPPRSRAILHPSRPSGCNSVGRVTASQAVCRRFESGHPLWRKRHENRRFSRLRGVFSPRARPLGLVPNGLDPRFRRFHRFDVGLDPTVTRRDRQVGIQFSTRTVSCVVSPGRQDCGRRDVLVAYGTALPAPVSRMSSKTVAIAKSDIGHSAGPGCGQAQLQTSPGGSRKLEGIDIGVFQFEPKPHGLAGKLRHITATFPVDNVSQRIAIDLRAII